jgi:hypothetical protein
LTDVKAGTGVHVPFFTSEPQSAASAGNRFAAMTQRLIPILLVLFDFFIVLFAYLLWRASSELWRAVQEQVAQLKRSIELAEWAVNATTTSMETAKHSVSATLLAGEAARQSAEAAARSARTAEVAVAALAAPSPSMSRVTKREPSS